MNCSSFQFSSLIWDCLQCRNGRESYHQHLGLDEITDTMSLVYHSNSELRKHVVFLVLHGTQWHLVTESFRILIAHPLWLCVPPFRCSSWQPHLV